MAYASKLGRARISARNPQAAGICDRCGFVYNHNRLSWQYDWAGASLINKRILVCDTCLDVPQQQLRAIVIPADPVPIQNPRIQDYVTAETDYRTTQGNTVNYQTGIPVPGGDTRITQNDDNRVTQQTGEAPGGRNQLPGTDWNVPSGANGMEIPVVWTNNNDQGSSWENNNSQILPTVHVYEGSLGGIGVPYGNTMIPYTGYLPPYKNYVTIWNNTVLWNVNWSNNQTISVTWNTTIL